MASGACIVFWLSDKLAMHNAVIDMLKRFKLHLKLMFKAVEFENASQGQ